MMIDSIGFLDYDMYIYIRIHTILIIQLIDSYHIYIYGKCFQTYAY
jgi:hypothetical protein